MNELLMALRIVLANKFVMYFKAHSYHWNVESDRFKMLHDFFGEIYGEIHTSIDPVAEHIRILGAYAPISLMELYNYKLIDEDSTKPASCREMLISLGATNQQVIESLNKLFELAEAQNEHGLADFVAGRIDVHKKHGWMIKSHITGEQQ
jgi:starvation-inducible DNA-binding protein